MRNVGSPSNGQLDWHIGSRRMRRMKPLMRRSIRALAPLLRRSCALWLLALAVSLGQQAALRHELGHAFQRLDAASHQQLPPADTCEKCAAYSALFGGLLAAPASLALAAAEHPLHAFVLIPAPRRTVVATRSRAPPQHS